MTVIVSPRMTGHNDVVQATEGAVEKYLEHLRLRNLRATTIYGRARSLTRLRAWAGGPVLYLGDADLTAWQIARTNDMQPEAMRVEISRLRVFYAWCIREGLRHDDPTLRLIVPRVARRAPRPVGDVALAHALAVADVDIRAALALAAFCGLRAHEIAQLDWAEVTLHSHDPSLHVRDGKGGHSRRLPVSTALASILSELPHRRGPVIRRQDGQPGQNKAHTISHRANRFLHGIGVVETLHQMRHRFATAAYRACSDIRAVQELCGHASPTTTAIYTLPASEVARAAAEAAGRLDTAA